MRLAALNRRERQLLLLTVIVVGAAMFYSTVFKPLDVRNKKLNRELELSVLELNRLSLLIGQKEQIEAIYDNYKTKLRTGKSDSEEIPSFVEYFKKKHVDLLIGNRMACTGEMPYLRVIANKLASAAVSFMAGCNVEDSQSGYRLIRASFLKQLNLITSHYEMESEIIIRAGKRRAGIESIPIRSIYASEKSAISPFLDTLRFFILFIRSLFW